MENGLVLEDNKEYAHEESVELLEEVRGFFQGKHKMIGIEWISEKKKNNNENDVNAGAKLFVIKKGNQPLYESCNGLEDVERILDQFGAGLNALADDMYALVDNNQDLDKESKNSLESYAGAVDKGVTVFKNQRRRRGAKFKELSTVDDLKEELKHFMSEIIGNYVIIVLVDALYGRIKNHAGEIYMLAVNEINKFLAVNGVYTMEISAGDLIDPEYVEPTQDSIDNVTDDFNKFDIIEEVRRHPYLFTDGTKILDGSAKIWRRKD